MEKTAYQKQKVFVPFSFACVFFRPLTTSLISGASISNKTAPTLLAAGTKHLCFLGPKTHKKSCPRFYPPYFDSKVFF